MFETIIFLILMGLAIWVAWKIIKSILKALMIALLIALLIGGIAGLLVYRDVTDLRDNFASEPKLLLLESGEQIITGAIVGNSTKNMSAVPESDLKAYNELYINGSYSELRANFTRVIIFNEDFFSDGLPETVELEEFLPETFDKEEMMSLLTSSDAGDYQAYVFLSAVGHTMDLRGNTFLYRQFKAGNIILIPDTLTFKIARRLPNWIVIPVLWVLSL